MDANTPEPTTHQPRLVRAVVALVLVGLTGRPALGKLETWREDTSSAFSKAKRERLVVTESGHVRLGQTLTRAGTLDAVRIWDLARNAEGVLFAATGDEGKVYRREAKPDAPWTAEYDGGDTQALSLAVLPDGRVFAGTGPTGQVVEVSDPKHPTSRPAPEVKYIWDLATDAKGNLYAATGPNGQLWKRSAEGKWVLLLQSKHHHLRCVAVIPDGTIFAGSDGEGLVYRIAPDGKTSILFDASQSEVTALLPGPHGVVYVGTATESDGGGTGRTSVMFSGGEFSAGPKSGLGQTETAAAPEPPRPAEPPMSRSSPSRPSTGGSSPRRGAAGESAVYRLNADGVAREVFRVKALIFALAWQDDRLLVGTGPEGQLYEVRDDGRETAPLARLDTGQVLSLLAEPQGELLVGTGDPGAVFRLAAGHVQEGSLVSDVHDAKLVSRFGALSWRAVVPPGTSIALQARSGNVGEPDETWSDWSAPQTDPENSKALAPPGRFVQYRATLKTSDPKVTPELHGVSLRYQTANLPPDVTKVDVPDVSAGDGATRQTRLTLRWEADDPNDDDLKYSLQIRKEGWPEWIPLGEEPLTEKSFSWDTTTVPPGLYRVRVTASDRPSNNAEDAQSRDRESEPFVVDHEAPVVAIVLKGRSAAITLKDNLTRIAKAAYAVDGGEWVPIFPNDGLFDTPSETITLSLPELKEGPHVLVVRATDAAGNTGTGDALVPRR
ncbi:MAG: hypothetical protein P4L84_25515 [Isosphaeraceae bacterium]|nr:hypothetical protein [Isosphaeraceae bacterium]